MDDLTQRQQEILEFIILETQKKGYPPSVREIGDAVGLSSSSTVHAHLEKLQQLGYIRRDPTKPRAIEILKSADDLEYSFPEVIPVPVVGRVTAGEPILAVENIEEYYPLPKDFSSYQELFMLKVRGDSMIQCRDLRSRSQSSFIKPQPLGMEKSLWLCWITKKLRLSVFTVK